LTQLAQSAEEKIFFIESGQIRFFAGLAEISGILKKRGGKMAETKNLTNEKEATFFEMLDYLCSRIDFGKSHLDATSIRCMNILFTELRKDKKKYSIT
jgi:hypothetical protein